MTFLRITLPLLIFVTVGCSGLRDRSAIPFPYREELEYLTSEEEERLIYGGDMSVIHDKVRTIPDIDVELPSRPSELPVPTMDPPLPKIVRPIRPPKSNRGFPFRIPRIFLKNHAKRIPLNRKPRMKNVMPIPTYRARPSTLISSEPDELEIAFKRIEIMASRAGLNMSSMPRRTQMQVLKRLMPKLPPRMSNMVKGAMDSNSDRMYDYLPEPMADPVPGAEERHPEHFNQYNIHDDVKDEFGESVQQPVVHNTHQSGFDAGKVSIATSGGESDEFAHLPSITNDEAPSGSLLPPSEFSSFGDHGAYGEPGHHSFEYSRESKSHDKIVASPLTDYHEMEAGGSENVPVIISPGSSPMRNSKKLSQVKSVTLAPVRVALPTKDKFVQVPRPTARPIRVSIISKDTISVNRSEPVVKVIHIEEVTHDDQEQEGSEAVVTELKPDPPTTTTAKPVEATRVKVISKDIIQEEEAKHQHQQRPRPASTTTTTTTTTISPDILKLDLYDDWTPEVEEEQWGDPYDLTDEEISATVAELKKYEEQGIFENSLEQDYPWRLAPHPLEYPDHPDHPKDSFEEALKPEEEKPQTVKPPSPRPEPMNKRPFPPHGPFRRPPGGHGRRPPMRRPPMHRPHPHHHRRPGPPRPPPGPRPLRINDVTVSEIPKEFNKECDYFSEDLCLVVQDYPIEAISEAMEQNPDTSKLLVKEPADGSWVDGVQKRQEDSYNFRHYFGQRRSDEERESTHRHRDFAGEGGFLCPSKVAYGQVKKAKSSSSGDWKYVVNYGENTQTLRLEKCLSPGNTCSYVMPHYRTACTQVYNYHRLLAWEPEKGLHVDVFKVPTCCTCHVQGYYIPQQQHGFTPAKRPPRLNFAPPRTPMGRGAKRIPSNPVTLLKPVPSKSTPKPFIPMPTSSSAAKGMKDDLQDLLAQYSALREKITKKKNENVKISYSMSVSNGTDALRPKTRESRTSHSDKLKPLLKLKKLHENLKKLNGTSKPTLKTKLKRPFARALLLARLNRKLKLVRNRASNRRGKAMKDLAQNSTTLSKTGIQNRIQMLRTRLNKYNERKKEGPETAGSISQQRMQQRLREKTRLNAQAQQQSSNSNSTTKAKTTQRLRLGANRPSKVNYSYHPIMDYFNKGKSSIIAH